MAVFLKKKLFLYIGGGETHSGLWLQKMEELFTITNEYPFVFFCFFCGSNPIFIKKHYEKNQHPTNHFRIFYPTDI